MPPEVPNKFFDGPAHALVIGISSYQYNFQQQVDQKGFPNLKYSAKDARDFSEFLRDYGFNDYSMELLLDEQAKKQQIERSLEKLRRLCKQSVDPLVVVYFSGHGWAENDEGEERHYLIPHDAERDQLRVTAFSNKEFMEKLQELKTKRLVVFLDACHAGAMPEPGGKGLVELPQYDVPADLGSAGRLFLASCGPGQKSYESKEIENSIFTGHLLELLKCQTDDFDNLPRPEITLSDLYPVLAEKVKATTLRQYDKNQQPIADVAGGAEIVLALNPKVRARNEQEQKQLATTEFLDLICAQIKQKRPINSSTIVTRLRSYALKQTRAKGFDDFYGVFDDQSAVWMASRQMYSFEDGSTLLIDAYEFSGQAAAPVGRGTVTPQSSKSGDAMESSAARGGLRSQESRPQESVGHSRPEPPLPVIDAIQSGGATLVAAKAQAASGEVKTSRSRVFVSYSHKDKKRLTDLQTIFAPLIAGGLIGWWDDTMIEPGRRWQDEIEKALSEAKVAVLLVSADFLASDFIMKNELPPLLNKAKDDGVTIFWVKLSECLTETTDIRHYQAAHDIGKPLDKLSKADRVSVLTEVARKIIKFII